MVGDEFLEKPNLKSSRNTGVNHEGTSTSTHLLVHNDEEMEQCVQAVETPVAF